jgi:hypothetical protein
MKVHLFVFQCEVCKALTAEVKFGVGADGCLYVYYRCPCGQQVKAQLPLAQVIDMIPVVAATPETTDFDRTFLRGVKISVD